MNFTPGQRISDADANVTRYEVIRSSACGRMTFFTLRDVSSDIEPPYERILYGACLNYAGNYERVDQWLVESDRKQFAEACKFASYNITGFPVLIDYFHISNPDLKTAVSHLANSEPFIVFYFSKGFAAELKPGYIHSNSFVWPGILFNYVKGIGYIMKELHQTKNPKYQTHPVFVIRQVPPDCINRTHNSGDLLLTDFFSLALEGPSNYNPNIPFIWTERQFSAPECFDENGMLSPSTDVYALAKSLLMYLGEKFDCVHFPDELHINRMIASIESRYKKAIPDVIKRWLKISLQKHPKCRHRNIVETLCFLSEREYKEPVYTQGESRNRNDATNRPRDLRKEIRGRY